MMEPATKLIVWQIIFLIAFPSIIRAGLRPLEPLDEGPLWKSRIADALLSEPDDYSSENSRLIRHRFPDQDSENTDQDSLFPRAPSAKRALAMFARWGSINSIGKNRPPIRSNLYESDDQLSGNSRRMQGQPLRWG